MNAKDREEFIVLKKDVEYIREKLDHNTEMIHGNAQQMLEKIDKFIEEADKKYAPKWIEKMTWVIISLVIGALITAFFTLVLG